MFVLGSKRKVLALLEPMFSTNVMDTEHMKTHMMQLEIVMGCSDVAKIGRLGGFHQNDTCSNQKFRRHRKEVQKKFTTVSQNPQEWPAVTCGDRWRAQCCTRGHVGDAGWTDGQTQYSMNEIMLYLRLFRKD